MVKLKILIIISLSFLKILPVLSNNKNDRAETLSKLVKDVIENERVPSCLWAKTCWSKYDDFKFLKSMSIPVQVLKLTASINLPVDEHTNKQWIFVDMSCEWNLDFLPNVDEKYLAHPYRWIIVDATHESIQNLTILPNSNIIVATQNVNSMEYVLKQGNIRKAIPEY